MRLAKHYHYSDAYFLNALREVLGLCPLPRTHASAVEKRNIEGQRASLPLQGVPTGETDGCRHIGRYARAQ